MPSEDSTGGETANEGRRRTIRAIFRKNKGERKIVSLPYTNDHIFAYQGVS